LFPRLPKIGEARTLASWVKLLGLVPGLVGGLLSRLLDFDFLKQFDLLKGFLGVTPHIAALALFCVGWLYFHSVSSGLRVDRQNRYRRRWTGIAFGLLVLVLLLALVPFPEDLFTPTLTLVRWYLATILYLAFYVSLAASLA
jgi:hypothetical protein